MLTPSKTDASEPLNFSLKWVGSFAKTNIFIVAYTLVSPEKYFAKNF